jgi:transcriptional regulator with XRE-family HTH domain/tetratricopeptide (TPR) repeat protein
MKPNQRLKYEREIRGWSQAKVAEEIGSSEKNVSRWERGVSSPIPYFREKLCLLYGKSAQELGFVEDENGKEHEPNSHVEQNIPSSSPLYDPTLPPLPNEGWGLVGRQELLDALVEQLCAGKNSALSGLPGVGKTALAATLVHHPRVLETFGDGVLWAGLGPHPNVLEQLSRWGMLLGLPSTEALKEHSIEARALALRTAIGQRRMVLVIDDAWEIESALPFKVGGSNCVLLATTRFPGIALGIARDGVHAVHELNTDDGLALLTQLAPEVVTHDTGTAESLVQEVGGLPLALTLMGKYLQTQAHSGQPRRLQAALTRLRHVPQRLLLSEPQPPLERSPSLAAGTPLSLQSAIAVSDQQLDEQTRAVLRALSVFPAKPNSFAEEAALAVSQAPAEVLDVLFDAGLLESSGVGRYTLHQTIADYANAHLAESLASERLVAYITAYIESHATDYESLERESRNILAGLRYAFEAGRHAKFVRGINTFAPFLLARGLYDLAKLHLQRAYQTAIWSGDILAVATVRLHLGTVAYRQGDDNLAEVYLRESLTLARECENGDYICRLLILLSEVALRQGNFGQAEIYAQEGLQLAREYADNQRICDLLTNLARVARARDDDAQMELYLQEALAQQSELHLITSQVLSEWGELKLKQRQFTTAQAYFQQALAQASSQEDVDGIAMAQYGLARIALAQGKQEEARQLAQDSLSSGEPISQSLANEIAGWLAELPATLLP